MTDSQDRSESKREYKGSTDDKINNARMKEIEMTNQKGNKADDSSPANNATLLTLPNELLIQLPTYLHTIEDYIHLSATNRRLRTCLSQPFPRTILRLAAAQSRIFFRPSPHYLVAATAREVGRWARESRDHETVLQDRLQLGIEGLFALCLEIGSLTLERIRALHRSRFEIVNPVVHLIDRAVGEQWRCTEGFWDGAVSDAYTVDADPPVAFFHLVIYGELFGEDFEALWEEREGEGEGGGEPRRRLSVDTRLEYVKYCIPDFATQCDPLSSDPRRQIKPTGPYAPEVLGEATYTDRNDNVALVWLLNSSRWRPSWRAARELSGEEEFREGFEDEWWTHDDEDPVRDWRQRLWENIMLCQGWEGMAMLRPGLRDEWAERITSWREKVARLEKEPEKVRVQSQETMVYPFLLGDLRICGSGYVAGT